jgi:uncharacterized protein
LIVAQQFIDWEIDSSPIRPMTLIFALLLVVVLLASWLLTFLNLPGNWLMVLATAVYACFVPPDSRAAIGWKVVVAILVMAILGEIVELIAGAAGTVKAGGTRRGALFALLGSVVGGFVGILVGVPIPIVGPVFAALLFAGLGAMTGAMLGEISVGKSLGTSWQVGKAAFRGRLIGTLGKTLLGAAMLVLVIAALFL